MSLLDYVTNIRFRNRNKIHEYFDIIRKKWFRLYPEELVRQAFVWGVYHELSIPFERMKIEQGVVGLKSTIRTDLVIYDREVRPLMLVECKAFDHQLNISDRAQILHYNGTIKSPNILLTNGVELYVAKAKTYEFHQIENLTQLRSHLPLL